MEQILLNHTKKEYFFFGVQTPVKNATDLINLIKMKDGWNINDDYGYDLSFLEKYTHITYNKFNMIKIKLNSLSNTKIETKIEIKTVNKSPLKSIPKPYYGKICICRPDKINLNKIHYLSNQIIPICYYSSNDNEDEQLIKLAIQTPKFTTTILNMNININININDEQSQKIFIDSDNQLFNRVIYHINKLIYNSDNINNDNDNDNDNNNINDNDKKRIIIEINSNTILFNNKKNKIRKYPKRKKTYKDIISLNSNLIWVAEQIQII